MSVQEINVQLEKLTPTELAEVETRVRILRVTTAPGYKERITAANRRLAAGEGVSDVDFEAKLARRVGRARAR